MIIVLPSSVSELSGITKISFGFSKTKFPLFLYLTVYSISSPTLAASVPKISTLKISFENMLSLQNQKATEIANIDPNIIKNVFFVILV